MVELLVVLSMISFMTFAVLSGINGTVSKTNVINAGEFVKNIVQNEKVKSISHESIHTKITFTTGNPFFAVETTKFDLPYKLVIAKNATGDPVLTLAAPAYDETVYTLVKIDHARKIEFVSSIKRDTEIPLVGVTATEGETFNSSNLTIDKNHENILFVLPPTREAEENTIYNTLNIQYFDMNFVDEGTTLQSVNGSTAPVQALIDLYPNLQTSFSLIDVDGNITSPTHLDLTLVNTNQYTTTLTF